MIFLLPKIGPILVESFVCSFCYGVSCYVTVGYGCRLRLILAIHIQYMYYHIDEIRIHVIGIEIYWTLWFISIQFDSIRFEYWRRFIFFEIELLYPHCVMSTVKYSSFSPIYLTCTYTTCTHIHIHIHTKIILMIMFNILVLFINI